MASKSKGIPSWQKEKPRKPSTNDDPVYSQAQAAANSPANEPSSTQASTASLDDPVYAQAAASPSEIASESPSSSPSKRNDDPVYAQADASEQSSAERPENDDPVYAPAEAQQSSNASSPADSTVEPRHRDRLLVSASKFLQHEDLRAASLERKKAFLVEKGLMQEEIDGLLDNVSTDTSTASTSTTHSNPTLAQPSLPTASQTAQASPSQPPIITYPEFLMHAHRPKPLVTRTRIINAVYATGLISGTLYLASRYLFEPMAEQMGVARHELFATAQKCIDGLNEKLEANVSVVPPKRHAATGKVDAEAEVESVASDPEELFHRDIGVQTKSPSEDGRADGGDKALEGGTVVEKDTGKLLELKGHIATLSTTGKDALEEDEATRSAVGDLQAYLEELAYGGRKPTFSWDGGFASESAKDSKMDEIAKFKSEIRSVKGALLSARNFPVGSSGSMRVR